jgi:hypothetical protein
VVSETALPALGVADAPDQVAYDIAVLLGGTPEQLQAGPAAVVTTRDEHGLRLQALVPVPDAGRLLVLTASTPVRTLDAPYERLFRAVVGTVRWG